MKLLPDQQRVKTLLADTITLLCKNGLNYNSEFCIDALIGITVDQSQVFLVNINETIGKDLGVLVKNSNDNKPKKRKPVENGGSGLDRLVNGDYNSSSSGGVSRNKIPRFHESNIKPKSRSSPSPVSKDVSKSLSNNREGTSNDYVVVTHDDHETVQSNNKKSPFSSYDHSNSYKDSYKDKGPVQIKPEGDLEEQGENESEIAMQLLYSQSDNAEEESDISNVEHQVTGPPVWPEPTLSFSSGLTMPTIIAPESGPQSSPCNTPSTDDTTPNQANVSQTPWQQACCKCHPRSSGSCVRCHPGGKCTMYCKNKNCRWNRTHPRRSRKKPINYMNDIMKPCAAASHFGGPLYMNSVYDAGDFSVGDQFMTDTVITEDNHEIREGNIEECTKVEVDSPELIIVNEDIKPVVCDIDNTDYSDTSHSGAHSRNYEYESHVPDTSKHKF